MKHWIQAARLRTLPLSVSGILVGSFYAMSQSYFNWKIIGFALLTTIGLQVLSNFANDYGDGVKGTDNEDRVGPKRTIQSGLISPSQMKNAMFITACITLIFALLLIYVSFKNQYIYYSLFFLFLGIVAIGSAIKYTVGKNPYGYRGFGDVFVFIFFGLVSTYGVYFLYTKTWDWILLLPSIAIGLLSVGVLNLNNMRDEESDKKVGKNTLVVMMGRAKAKMYHSFLIVVSILCLTIFGLLKGFAFDQYLYVIGFLPLISHLIRVHKTHDPKNLDPELKRLALTTFLISILLSLCLIYFISDIIMRS
ncbi:MAG: 1,4-dihydroxy-2-naphthoate polyprenyltransferase [Flavobacterium sp.]